MINSLQKNQLIVSCFDANKQEEIPERLKNYEEYLSDSIKNQLQKYKSDEHRKESLIGKLLLIQQLSKFHGIQPELIEFEYTLSNRPFLKNSHIDFNISHSGGYVLVSTVTKGTVGVDIEKERPINPDLYSSFFSEELRNEMKRDRSLFFKHWTLLEAITKANGVGISGNFGRYIDLLDSEGEEKQFFKIKLPQLFLGCYQHIITMNKIDSMVLYRL